MVNSVTTKATSNVGAQGTSGAAALKLIKLAQAEKFHEGPNNDNPYTKHVMGDAHQPWCAAFVSTMLERAQIPGVSKKMFSASARGLASQFEQAGRYLPSSKTPQPGDAIFFGGRGNEHHTGIVTKVENGKVYTVEGNSSDQVSQRVYSLNDPGIGGYGRVFGEGTVPPDVGADTSQASHGSAGGRPAGRATGRGSAHQASETGVDPVSYTSFSLRSLLAFLEALLNGDSKALQAALEDLFPYASTEDLAAVGELLGEHPELAAKIATNPELLQQLVASPTEETVQQLLQAPATPLEQQDPSTRELGAALVASKNFNNRTQALTTLAPMLPVAEVEKARGWAQAAPSFQGNWTPK